MAQLVPRQPALADSFGRRWDWLRRQPAFRRRPVAVLARLALWRARCLVGRWTEIELERDGLRLRLPPEWRGVAKLLYAFREDHEPELTFLRRHLRPGMVVADVGACYGIYTLVAARLVEPGGQVLAFEPAATSFGRLAANVKRNGLANVRLFRMAAWDECGSAPLFHACDPSRNSLDRARCEASGWEIVRLGRLDDVLEACDPGRLDLLKVDVEGAEAEALRGAVRSLRTWRPVVIFEKNSPAAADLLGTLGYELYRVDEAGRLVPALARAGGNLVAVSRQTL